MKKLIILLLLSSSAMAEKYTVVDAEITQIQINKVFYGGGCLVYVPTFTGKGSCADNWVSLQCDAGNFSRTENAKMMLVHAYTALANNKKIDLTVNHARRIDKHCVVESISLKR